MAITSNYRSGTTGVSDATSQTTYTFTAADIGTASDDRYVLVGIAYRASVARTISTVTIGGVSAAAVTTAITDDTTAANFYGAFVSSGTTGDIVVTLSGAALRMVIGVWALTGVGSTSATVRVIGNSGAWSSGLMTTSSMSCDAGGAVFGLVTSTDGTSLAWSGITERYDVVVSTLFGAASLDFAVAQSGLTVTATKTGGSGSQSSGSAYLLIALTSDANTAATLTGGGTLAAGLSADAAMAATFTGGGTLAAVSDATAFHPVPPNRRFLRHAW